MSSDFIQKEIIKSDKDKIVILASAGSGKTKVLIDRINFLIEDGINPSEIYAITFTNAAADEMKMRLKSDKVFVGTIHGLANQILISQGIDTSDIIAREAYDELLKFFIDGDNDYIYDVQLPNIEYLLLDEAHDISKIEYAFIFSVLAPEKFFVVCDTKQAIYSFRGSNFKQMNKLLKRKDVSIYEMNHNYRCGRAIVEFANTFIEDMENVFQQEVTAEDREGEVVINNVFNWTTIKKYLNDDSYGNYGDWFILCRTNSQVDSITTLLNKEQIPNITFKKGGLTADELAARMGSNAVKVLTIHASKGLQNKNVIVIGGKQFNDEENRVCYVAATRAENLLIWVLKEGNLNNLSTINSDGWSFI